MTDLIQLKHVAQLRYDRRRQDFVKIVRQEAVLRNELKRLDNLTEASKQQREDLHEMRITGADVLWEGWVARAKTKLNTELAQVLAQKAREQNRVKAEFGKLTAIDTLIKQQDSAKRQKSAKARLENTLLIEHRKLIGDQ